MISAEAAPPAIVEFGPSFRTASRCIAVSNDIVYVGGDGDISSILPSGEVVQYHLPGDLPCLGMGVGSDAAIWVDGGNKRIVRFTTKTVSSYVLRDAGLSSDERVSGSEIRSFFAGPAGAFASSTTQTGVYQFAPAPATVPIDREAGNVDRLAAAVDGSRWYSRLSPRALLHRDPNGAFTTLAADYVATHRLEDLHIDRDGSLFALSFTNGGDSQGIVRISTSGDVAQVYSLDDRDLPAFGLVFAYADDAVWYGSSLSPLKRIDRGGDTRVYRDGLPPGNGIGALTVASDGSAWFADPFYARVVHVSVDGRVRTLGNGLSPFAEPAAPVVTADGTLWYRETLSWHPRIVRMSGAGKIDELPDAHPGTLIARGDDVFAADAATNRAIPVDSRSTKPALDLRGCLITDASVACFPSRPSLPVLAQLAKTANAAVLASDGAIWFTDTERSLIGRVDARGAVRTFTRGLTRFRSGPQYLTLGGDGRLWFTEQRDRVGAVALDGTITEYSGLPFRSFPGGIVAGPDGNCWFTLYHGNELVRITPHGAMRRFRHGIFPSRGNDSTLDSVPYRDSRGRIWFNEPQGGRIARANVHHVRFTLQSR